MIAQRGRGFRSCSPPRGGARRYTRRMFRCAIVLTALAVVATPVLSGQGRGKGHQEREASGRAHNAAARTFLTEEIRIVRGYYRPGGHLPPGLAKRDGDLPPGLEKQVRRNGRLPPGIEKRLAPFPPDLEMRLPPLPPLCRHVVLGTRALLVDDAANLVLDILDLTRGR